MVAVLAALVALVASVTAWHLRDDSEAPRANKASGITVDTSYKADKTRIETCAAGDEQCARRALGNLAYRRGPRAALAAMVKFFGVDGDAACHQSAHEIGRASLAHFKGSVGDAFAAGTTGCFSGYYHGLFESAFASVEPTPDALGGRAKRLCDSAVSTRTGFDQYNCLHGVGHGLLLSTGDIQDAGHACRHILGPGRAVECFGGVMMEALTPSSGRPSPFTREDNLEYPCNVLAGSERAPCYASLAGHLLERRKFRWRAAAQDCLSIDADYRGVCVTQMGSEAANLARWDIPRMVAMCRQLTAFVDRCVGGAADAMMGNFHSAARGLPVCAAARGVPIADCRRSVAHFIALFATSRDDALRRCHELVPEVPDDYCNDTLAPR
jgi:hypothetical protein